MEWLKTVPLCEEDKIKLLNGNAKRSAEDQVTRSIHRETGARPESARRPSHDDQFVRKRSMK